MLQRENKNWMGCTVISMHFVDSRTRFGYVFNVFRASLSIGLGKFVVSSICRNSRAHMPDRLHGGSGAAAAHLSDHKALPRASVEAVLLA